MDFKNLNKDKKVRKKTAVDVSTMMYGKVPPQHIGMERAILGAIMIDKSAFYAVKDILQPDYFYADAHQKIFQAFCDLDNTNRPIDLLTVASHLQSKEQLELVGGPYFISKLTDHIQSGANIEEHAAVVLQDFLKRFVIQSCGELISAAYEDTSDSFDLVNMVLSNNDAITNNYLPRNESYQKLVSNTISNILNHGSRPANGIPSGFFSLDRIIDFFLNGIFYVIAARPSMGKTAFMVQLVENLTKCMEQRARMVGDNEKPQPIGIIEMETYDEAFIHRQLANITGIDSRKFKTGQLTEDEKKIVTDAGDILFNKGILCDFNPVSTINQIKIKAKSWKTKHNVGAILIDYLQYVSHEDDKLPRRLQVGQISKGLAGLAKELKIPIIAFAQLSREVYKRADKRPIMPDLGESGSIEQDARCVMFLHRPEYYGEVEDPITGASTVGITELIVAKNNDGDIATIKLRMLKELSKFVEVNDFADFEEIIPQMSQATLPGWDEDVPF